jgi:hypothetical protein
MAIAEVLMKAKLDTNGPEELVRDHGHLVLSEPLGIFVRIVVEEVRHTRRVQQ